MSGCECKPGRAQPSIDERLRMQARQGAASKKKEIDPMGNPLKFALLVLFAVATTAAQTPAGQTALGPNQLQTQIRRLPNGKPDLSGIWQALNTADWDLEGQGGGRHRLSSSARSAQRRQA